VLSDTGKYELHRPTREKLARLSGIVLSHPDLNLEIEGHTDSTGSDELNRRLSGSEAQRAQLPIDHGLSPDSVTASAS
jgi:outer membrane protein OmpA-like peptidoglycan-associated protein